MTRLNKIEKGSKLGIISPSSSIASKAEINMGLDYLQKLGYEPILGEHVFDNYFATGGLVADRAKDIMSFFANKDIKGIFCTRGGYNSHALLPELDYDIIKSNPKPIFGFSDITALQMGIYSQTGNVSCASILLKYDFESGGIAPITNKSLQDVLGGNNQKIQSGKSLNGGVASGVLLGTNLCVFQSLAGTKYYPDLTNSILFFEDVDASTYQIETYLNSLKQNEGFAGVRAIVFGQWTDINIRHSNQKDITQILDNFAKDVKIPMIKDFAFGHVYSRYSLPLGASVSIDANNCTISF